MSTTFRAAAEKETDLVCLYHVANDFGKQLSFALRHKLYTNLKIDVTWPSTAIRYSFEYATSADAMDDVMFITNRIFTVVNTITPLNNKVYPSSSLQHTVPQMNARYTNSKQQQMVGNPNQNQFRLPAFAPNSAPLINNMIAQQSGRMVIPPVKQTPVVPLPTQFKGVTAMPTLPTPHINSKALTVPHPTQQPKPVFEPIVAIPKHIEKIQSAPSTPKIFSPTADRTQKFKPERHILQKSDEDSILDEEIAVVEETIKKVAPVAQQTVEPVKPVQQTVEPVKPVQQTVETFKPVQQTVEPLKPAQQPDTKETSPEPRECTQTPTSPINLKDPKLELSNFIDLHILSESAQAVKESVLRKRKRESQEDSDDERSTSSKRQKVSSQTNGNNIIPISQWRIEFKTISAFDKREFIFDKKIVNNAPLTKKLLEQKWAFKFGKTVFQIEMVCYDGSYQMKLVPMVASHISGEYLWSEYTGDTKHRFKAFKDLHKTPGVIHSELIGLLRTKPTVRVAPETLFLVDTITIPSDQGGYWQFPRGFSYERLKDLCMIETDPKYKSLIKNMEKFFFKSKDAESDSEDCSDQIV